MKLLDYDGLDYYNSLIENKYALKSDLNSYLPLTGGTMTGQITQSTTSLARRDINNSWLYLGGGTSDANGAYLVLSGKDRSGTLQGAFGLKATDGTNSKYLYGYPDGTLTWNNTNISLEGHTHSDYSTTSHNHDERYEMVGNSGVTTIPANTDLNTITTHGTYLCTSWSSIGETYTNCPSVGSGFKLIVSATNTGGYLQQRIYNYSGNVWIRGKNSSTTWSAWRKVAYTDSDITGNAATATLADKASSVLLDVTGTAPVLGEAIALPFQYKNKSTDSSNTVKTTAPFFCFPSNNTAANGEGFGIQTNGCIAIGAGESAKNLISTSTINGGTENVYITADNTINIHSNCNTIENRKSWAFDANGQIVSYDRAITRGTAPSSAYSRWLLARVAYGNENSKYMGGVYKTISTANITGTYLYDYPNTETTSTSVGVGGHAIGICHDASGNAYTTAPTPTSLSSNDTSIATTKWVTSKLGGYSETSHNHAASDITSGTLGVARGGTGQTSAVNAANAFINALSTGSNTPVDADYFISQYVGGGTSTTTYYRRPMSELWSYIKGKADSVYSTTDTNVTKTVTNPTSSTTWYPIATTSSSTSTGTTVFNTNTKFVNLTGTASAAGYNRLYLGNTTATGTAGNSTGSLLMYGETGKYVHLIPHDEDTSNRTINFPKSGGELVVHTKSTAIGSASTPVYVSANGVATACTSLDATKLSGTIPTDCYTNTTYSAGTAALLTAGTNTSNRVWQAKIIADYVKGTLSAEQDGYVELPNGLIINWGKYVHSTGSTTASKTVTFSKAYSTACYSVVFGLGGSRNINVNFLSMSWIQATAITKTNFTIGSVNSNYPQYWMAIGV